MVRSSKVARKRLAWIEQHCHNGPWSCKVSFVYGEIFVLSTRTLFQNSGSVCVALTDIGESLRSRDFLKGGPRSTVTYPRNGSPTRHLALSPLREYRVARSSPFTLTIRWLYQSPPLPLRMDPQPTPLTTRGRALAAPCLGRSKVRPASLVRVLNDGKISWVLGSQGYGNSFSTNDQSKATLVCSEKKAGNPEDEVTAPEKSRTHQQPFCIELPQCHALKRLILLSQWALTWTNTLLYHTHIHTRTHSHKYMNTTKYSYTLPQLTRTNSLDSLSWVALLQRYRALWRRYRDLWHRCRALSVE